MDCSVRAVQAYGQRLHRVPLQPLVHDLPAAAISLKRPIGSQCADRRLLRIPGTGVHGSWQTGHPHPEAQRYHQTRSPLDISAGG